MLYQPIVRWSDRSVFGYEALVRSTEESLPDPHALFDAAHQADRISDLGRRIRSHCADSIEDCDPAAALFVNLHSRELKDEALYDLGSPLGKIAGRVVLEITERTAMHEVDDVVGRLTRLRAMGFRIAVDDIGAGYSGLNSLVMLKPDVVKLDMSLVRGIDTDRVRPRLVALLIDLCRDFDAAIVAEGVETDPERETLCRLGVDLFQGHLFAHPAPPFPGADI